MSLTAARNGFKFEPFLDVMIAIDWFQKRQQSHIHICLTRLPRLNARQGEFVEGAERVDDCIM